MLNCNLAYSLCSPLAAPLNRQRSCSSAQLLSAALGSRRWSIGAASRSCGGFCLFFSSFLLYLHGPACFSLPRKHASRFLQFFPLLFSSSACDEPSGQTIPGAYASATARKAFAGLACLEVAGAGLWRSRGRAGLLGQVVDSAAGC